METLIYLAVLQGQIKDICCASNEADPNAVQHHPFTALEDNRGQVLGLDFTDELPKTGCDCVLQSWMLQDCSEEEEKQMLVCVSS